MGKFCVSLVFGGVDFFEKGVEGCKIVLGFIYVGIFNGVKVFVDVRDSDVGFMGLE